MASMEPSMVRCMVAHFGQLGSYSFSSSDSTGNDIGDLLTLFVFATVLQLGYTPSILTTFYPNHKFGLKEIWQKNKTLTL